MFLIHKKLSLLVIYEFAVTPPGPTYFASPKARIGKNTKPSKSNPTVNPAPFPKDSDNL